MAVSLSGLFVERVKKKAHSGFAVNSCKTVKCVCRREKEEIECHHFDTSLLTCSTSTTEGKNLFDVGNSICLCTVCIEFAS